MARRCLTWLLVATWLAGCKAAAVPAGAPAQERAPEGPACAGVPDEAERALGAGRLERAVASLEQEIERCPSNIDARRALLSTLVTLGYRPEAAAQADAIARDPRTPEDERSQVARLVEAIEPTSAEQASAWVDEGMAALARGDEVAGRWLLSRALVALEGGRRLASLSLPNGPRGALPWRSSTRSPLARRARAPVAASQRLLAQAEGREIRALDVASGREVHSFSLSAAVADLALPPDGSALAALGADGALTVWKLKTGIGTHYNLRPGARAVEMRRASEVEIFYDDQVQWLQVDAGRFSVAAGEVRGLDDAGQALLERDKKLYAQGPGQPAQPALPLPAGPALLSPDGAWAAAVTAAGVVQLHPLRAGRRAASLASPVKGAVRLSVASEDGEWLLGAVGGAAVLWSTTTGKAEARDGWRPAAWIGGRALLEGDSGYALWEPGRAEVQRLNERPGVSPRDMFTAGPLLLSAGGHESVYRRWDPQSGKPTGALDALHAEALMAPAVRADGALAGVDPDGSARVIWPERGEQAKLSLAGDVARGLAFSGPSLAAFSEGKLRIFHTDDGHLTSVHDRPQVGKQFGAFGGGSLLATLASHGWLQIFDVAAARGQKTLEGSRINRTVSAAIAPGGRWVATGEREGEVRVWDLPEGGEPARVISGEHKAAVKALAFAGPDRLCSGDEAGQVLCRDLPSGAALALAPTTPLGEVTALAALDGGEVLVVSQSLLGVRARVFDAGSGKQLRSLGELLPIDGDAVAVHRGALLAPSTLAGATLLLRLSDGAPLGALRSLRDGRGAYYLDATGRVELLGTSLKGVGACRVGFRSFPLELCIDRLDTPGLLRSTLAGEP